MEDDKRWALISEVGGDAGYLEELAAVLERRFHLVGHREFLRDPERHGPRVQVLFNWKFLPAVEPSLLRSLPALRLVASGGVGVDHLDVAFINGLGVKVANTPGVVGGATADLAMGLLLASARKILHGEVKGHENPLTCNTHRHDVITNVCILLIFIIRHRTSKQES